MALPRGAMGLSAVCDCGISRSYSRTIFNIRNKRSTQKLLKKAICIINFEKKNLKPHSHCAGVATVHPDAGQPVYRDAPGHIS